MKKILHLVWNSHIDPVWQWDWDEGAAAALSTFYAACELLDKYDFVFCHNEALLYEYIEKYDPKLFKRIETFVAEGKWKIMGGWYVQPDCLVPSGESFIRQISVGREYFGEKFNTRPTTAMNFDSFGHTRGLPQILKKCGFDSYIFCRPLYQLTPMLKKDLPTGPFLWEGYDGSTVKTLRYIDREANYTARLGHLREDILRKINYYKDADIAPILWGVGNHGGLNSAQDLEDILVLKDEKKGEWEIIHSTLEDYFNSVNPTIKDNRQFTDLIKSYSSVHAIKLAHDQLENALYLSEKICTYADLCGKYAFNRDPFLRAEKVLSQIAFHDVLSGTAIKLGTDSSIRKAHHAIEEVREEMYAAINAFAQDLPKVTPNDDNVILFNPYPYEFEGYVESEFYCVTSCLDNQIFKFNVYDMDGKSISHQSIREESLIAHQKRVRLLFKAKVPACSVVSYGIHAEVLSGNRKPINQEGDIVVKDSLKTVVISRKTGLLTSFNLQGKEYLAGPSCSLHIFNDNPDAWGWRINNLTHNVFNENGWPTGIVKNTLRQMRLDNSQKGPFENLLGVTTIEEGKHLTQVQALFKGGASFGIINYKIFKDVPYIDVHVRVLWNEASKGLKLKLSLNGERKWHGQMAFGVEKNANNGYELPHNRFIAIKNEEEAFVVYNRSGVHSSSKRGKDLYITLLNGAAYCSHPTNKNQPMVCDLTRYVPYIEQGASEFSFRFQVNKLEECERLAQEFNQPIYSLNYFPHGDGKNVAKNTVVLSNPNIVMTALKKRKNGGYIIRLYNGLEKPASTKLTILGVEKQVNLKKYEFKTYVFDHNEILEVKDASIY